METTDTQKSVLFSRVEGLTKIGVPLIGLILWNIDKSNVNKSRDLFIPN